MNVKLKCCVRDFGKSPKNENELENELKNGIDSKRIFCYCYMI